jgi:DNA adenine methylase
MVKDLLIAPVLKWVGGALLFSIQPKIAFINDINEELMSVYRMIKDDVESLISALQEHKNESEYFYAVRNWDRNKEKYALLSDVQKAARILYLNKTCYNGLFRVNSAGGFFKRLYDDKAVALKVHL